MRTLLCLLFLFSLSGTAFAGEPLGFKTVDPGRCYRSSQPNREELKYLISKYHIKTIINLRGYKNEKWYEDEQYVTTIQGVHVIDFRLCTDDDPNKLILKKLREMIIQESKTGPILIHCKWGWDRTGFAVAVYQYERMGDTKAFKKLRNRPSRWLTPKVDQWAQLYEHEYPKFFRPLQRQ